MAWPKNNGYNCSRLVDPLVMKFGKHVIEKLTNFLKMGFQNVNEYLANINSILNNSCR